MNGRGIYSNRISVMINSFIAFMLAWMILMFLNDLIIATVAKTFGIQSKLFFNRVEFFGSYYRWDKLSVTVVYASAPLVFFVLGIVFYRLHNQKKYLDGFLNLFFLWSFVVCMVLFWGNLLYSSIVYRGLAAVYAWLKIPDVVKITLSVFSFFILLFLGVFLNKAFLMMSHSRKYIKQSFQVNFLFFIAFLPFVFGSILILALNAAFFYTTEGVLMMLVLLGSVGIIAFATTFLTLNTSKHDMVQFTYGFELNNISILTIVLFASFMILSIIFMNIGIVM